VKGSEDEARTVDKEEMIAFFHGSMDSAAALRGPYKLDCTKALRLTKLLPICNRRFFPFPLKNHILNHKSQSPAFDRAAGLIAGLSPAASGLDKGLIPLSGPLSPFSSRHGLSSRPWRLLFFGDSLRHSKIYELAPMF
jgi:hypothetical protein